MKKNHKGVGLHLKKALKAIVLLIYKATFGLYICLAYHVRVIRNDMKGIKGPFLLIGNHVTDYDGCFMQQHAGKPVSFVINDKAFRSPVLRAILLFFDMIPKKKFSSDIQAVRRIFRAKERGDIVGVFPEGSRTWDGNTLRIIRSTATLVKSVRLPVVAAHISGGATASPRWRDGRQGRGVVEIEYQKLLDADVIRTMSDEDIHKIIEQGIRHDEAAFTTSRKISFVRKNRAEGLERFLFICPECESLCTTRTHGDEISCACGMTAVYTEYGTLAGGRFDTLAKWDAWQRSRLASRLADMPDDEMLFSDHVEVYCARGPGKFRHLADGTACISKDSIRIGGDPVLTFNTGDISGVNIQNNNIFEFNHGSACYRLSFPGKASAYKWEMLYDLHIGCSEI